MEPIGRVVTDTNKNVEMLRLKLINTFNWLTAFPLQAQLWLRWCAEV